MGDDQVAHAVHAYAALAASSKSRHRHGGYQIRVLGTTSRQSFAIHCVTFRRTTLVLQADSTCLAFVSGSVVVE